MSDFIPANAGFFYLQYEKNSSPTRFPIVAWEIDTDSRGVLPVLITGALADRNETAPVLDPDGKVHLLGRRSALVFGSVEEWNSYEAEQRSMRAM